MLLPTQITTNEYNFLHQEDIHLCNQATKVSCMSIVRLKHSLSIENLLIVIYILATILANIV